MWSDITYSNTLSYAEGSIIGAVTRELQEKRTIRYQVRLEVEMNKIASLCTYLEC